LATPPSDASIVATFRANREHLEALTQMLRVDKRVGTIGEDFLFERDKPFLGTNVDQLGITPGRLTEYRSHMNSSRVSRLDRLDNDDVQFNMWGWGAIDTFHHKGVAWLSVAPQSGPQREYRKLDGQWYIYED